MTSSIPSLNSNLSVELAERSAQRPGRGEGDKLGIERAATESDAFLMKFLPGNSISVRRLRELVARLNSTDKRDLIRTVLIRGETGAGKSHLARVIAAHHRWSLLKASEGAGLEAGLSAFDDRFSEIHLPALPDSLVESELFGHVAGAFTDAKHNKTGLLSEGGKDEILLDEIGDISLPLQAKLLQVIEHHRFRPLGADDEEQVSARLLLATNRPLERLVAERLFREDLYQRVRLFVVTVPPLRDQPENIELLARRIENDLQAEAPAPISPASKSKALGSLAADDNSIRLSGDDLAWAKTYAWPGNIRELKYAIMRWRFEDGRTPLRRIVEDLRREEGSHGPDLDIEGAVSALVSSKLDQSLFERKSPAPTIGDMVKEFTVAAQTAMSSWNMSRRPSKDDLMRLFPKHSRHDSIQNTLRKWGKP